MPQKNSASANREAIRKLLLTYADGKYAGSGIERDFDSGHYLVVLPSSAAATTDRALSMLERRIARELDLPVKATRLVGELSESLSVALLKAMAKSFGDALADIIVAVDERLCNVVFVMQSAEGIPSAPARRKVKRRLERILESLDLELDTVAYALLRDDIPSEYQIIRLVAKHAPVTAANLHEQLIASDLHVPSSRWLDRQLDKLVRGGYLLFQPKIGFTLTESGLRTLPRMDHRNSPDIQRALALARRKWV